MKRLNMTPKLKHTLEFIKRFQSAEGFSPTMQEIATNFEVSRTSAYDRVFRLHKQRLVRMAGGARRGITITDKGTFYLRDTPPGGVFTEHEKTAIRYTRLSKQCKDADNMLTLMGIPDFAEKDGQITGNSIDARLAMFINQVLEERARP